MKIRFGRNDVIDTKDLSAVAQEAYTVDDNSADILDRFVEAMDTVKSGAEIEFSVSSDHVMAKQVVGQ